MNVKQFSNPWVIVQAILFMFLIFMPTSNDFSLSRQFIYAAWLLGVIGWLILFKAVYDLRHSLAIEPIPTKTGKLETRGIYRFIRHPMYVAVFCIFLGIAVGHQNWIGVLLYFGLVAFFVAKSRYEERRLIKTYPQYKQYMQAVGGFFPRLP